MEVWSSFTRDPRDPRCAPLRASDHDRVVVQQVLDEAYADGRLDRAEYDERTGRARGVRVLGDVNPLLRDLVAPPAAPTGSLVHASRGDLERIAHREWVRKRREAVFSFLGATLVSSAIYLAYALPDLADHFPWPLILIAITLANLIKTAASRQELVDREVRRLEKRRAKEQRKPGWRP